MVRRLARIEARARVLQLCDIVNPLLKGAPVRKPGDQATDIEAMVLGLSEEIEQKMLREIYGGRDAGGAGARRGRIPKWSEWEI